MSKRQEIESKIERAQGILSDDDNSKEIKDAAKKKLEKLKTELAGLPPEKTDKSEKKKSVKGHKETDKSKKTKSGSSRNPNIITVGGIDYDINDCEQAAEALRARIQQHKESNGKRKTKSAMSAITAKVGAIIKKAVGELPASAKSTEAGSDKVVKKLNDVKETGEDFIEAIEALLGKKMADSKIKEAMKVIREAIKEIREAA